jgi:hypothetical protein
MRGGIRIIRADVEDSKKMLEGTPDLINDNR